MGDKAQGYSRHTNATLCLAQIVRNSQHHVHPLCGASVQCHAKDSATRQLARKSSYLCHRTRICDASSCRTQSQECKKTPRNVPEKAEKNLYP